MKKLFIKLKAIYLFNTLATILLILLLFIYLTFEKTTSNVLETDYNSNLNYVENITSNISELIQNKIDGNLYQTLSQNPLLRKEMEKNLQLFITEKYSYIYIVDKIDLNSKRFRILLDGTKNEDDRGIFCESFQPTQLERWNKVYQTKKSTYFEHKKVESLWLTYLKPIIINNKVEAIIAVDFSIKEHKTIVSSLKNLDEIFGNVIIFFMAVFFLMIWFAYFDNKREKEKEQISIELRKSNEKLELKTIEIKEESNKVKYLNQTLEKRVEDEVHKNREKDKQMFQQSKMAQMGEMLSMIAHQWRQPLSAINSTSISISIQAHFDKMVAKDIIKLSENISNYSQHLSQTIDDFRNFFKSNKEKTLVNFNELLEDVLNIVETSIENQNIKLIKNSNSDEKFETYSNEIKQVILNLMKNSEDILLEKKIKNPYIKININKIQNTHILEISDNGGGVAKENFEKIFEPYFSTKKAKNGTGLGLYMSKTIIEEHCKGKITISNNKNGAVFKIELN